MVRRRPWTPEEDKKLLLAHVIGSTIPSYNNKIPCSKYSPVLPDRNKASFSRRLNIIWSNPEYSSLIEIAKSIWPSILELLIDRDKLPKNFLNSENLSNYIIELHTLLEKKVLDTVSESGGAVRQLIKASKIAINSPPIECELDEIREMYNLSPCGESIDISERLESAENPKSYAEIINSSIICWNVDPSFSSEKEDINYKSIETDKLKTLIKIIMLVPDNEYNASKSFFLLKSFPSSLVDEVYNVMKMENIIIGNKNDKRIPGKNFTLSDKFIQIIKGPFPKGMINMAQSYLEILKNAPGPYPMPLTLTAGNMLCFTEFLASGKLKIDNNVLEKEAPTSFGSDRYSGRVGVMINPIISALKKHDLESDEQNVDIKRPHLSAEFHSPVIVSDSYNNRVKLKILETIVNSKEIGIAKQVMIYHLMFIDTFIIF